MLVSLAAVPASAGVAPRDEEPLCSDLRVLMFHWTTIHKELLMLLIQVDPKALEIEENSAYGKRNMWCYA